MGQKQEASFHPLIFVPHKRITKVFYPKRKIRSYRSKVGSFRHFRHQGSSRVDHTQVYGRYIVESSSHGKQPLSSSAVEIVEKRWNLLIYWRRKSTSWVGVYQIRKD